jgi:hypothetical protein
MLEESGLIDAVSRALLPSPEREGSGREVCAPTQLNVGELRRGVE